MRKLHRSGVAGVMLCSLLLPFSISVAAAGSKPMVEPIFTRYARIYKAPTLDFRAEFFRDKPMEEMTDFDGYTLSLDFTWPFNDRSQLRVLLPFYTNGDGDYDKPDDPMTVGRLTWKAITVCAISSRWCMNAAFPGWKARPEAMSPGWPASDAAWTRWRQNTTVTWSIVSTTVATTRRSV